jgi:type II secretory pathway component PulF
MTKILEKLEYAIVAGLILTIAVAFLVPIIAG